MKRFLIIGGSDAGISAALRARKLDREVDLTLVVADRYPSFSIGMEMSEALNRRGLRVALVEAMPSVLTAIDPEPGARVGEELGRHGVEVVTETRIEGIEADGNALGVRGNDGFERHVDLVLVVVGACPETALGAAAGVETRLRVAFKVSRRMEDNLPGVYAAGDRVETWHRTTARHTDLPLGTTSHKQSRITGENAVGGNRAFQRSLGTQSMRFFDRVIAQTGLHDRDARAADIDPFSAGSTDWDHNGCCPVTKRGADAHHRRARERSPARCPDHRPLRHRGL
jgi:NADPH-dependent 2,4-dienoyl-CoA reductase/sulfur reductase-like enzyme